jgi:hypothetical protein
VHIHLPLSRLHRVIFPVTLFFHLSFFHSSPTATIDT